MSIPRLRSAWLALPTATIYLVISTSGKFIVESPDPEFIDDPNRESILRVFLDLESVQRYCQEVQNWYQDEQVEPVSLDLGRLFGMIDDLEVSAVLEYGCPASIVICRVEADGIPEAIDVLWSAFRSTVNMYN